MLERAALDGVDTLVSRLILSDRIRAPIDCGRTWPLRDILEAHILCDVVDGLARIERDKAKS